MIYVSEQNVCGKCSSIYPIGDYHSCSVPTLSFCLPDHRTWIERAVDDAWEKRTQ